jgi:GNAT superfamily N-acetyltransferase
MSASPINIVEATPADLDRLFDLASRTMTLERLSRGLLHQKLLFNPYPDLYTYHTLIAERGGAAVGMLQHVIRPTEAKAWLGLFAVSESERRQGIARRLYDTARSVWEQNGVRTVDAMVVPSNYLVAGIDPRYTAALCFLDRLGFTQLRLMANMRAKLDRSFDTREQEERFRADGIDVRRADAGDLPRLERFFTEHFNIDWLHETLIALSKDPPAVHLALRGDDVIAFSAHSTMNQEWGNFGPIGAARDARGLGIGAVLLHRCMDDLQAAGHATAVIPAVGPYRFYSDHLDCVIERVFWRYRLESLT